MFRKGVEILILSFNYFKLSISYYNVCGFLIALTHLNSTEKLHRLLYYFEFSELLCSREMNFGYERRYGTVQHWELCFKGLDHRQLY